MLGDSVRRRQPGARRAKRAAPATRRRKGKWRWRPLLIALPLALVLPFVLGYVLAVYVLFPPRDLAAGPGIPVPQLVGRSAGEAQRDLVAAGLGSVQTTELPHPSAPPGQVIAQSPLPGQQLRPGGDVRVALSAGRPRVVVPDVQGFSAERAESLLRRAGFDVTRIDEQSPLAAGRVLRTEPAPGQSQELPAAVTVVVSAGPPPPEPEPLPPDSAFVPGAGS
jgi:eukaryotic-like serine/threonine-protein kinase